MRSILSLSGMLLLLQACSNNPQNNTKTPPPPVTIDVIIVKPASFSYSLDASGTVQAQEFVELRPEVNGRITQLNIREGERIAAGTLLVKLNDDDLQAQLRKYQSQLEIAQRNQKRLKSLLDANGLNQQEYDIAESQVKSLQADVDFTKANIRKTEVRAPFSGVIGLRNVSQGAFVSSATLLATLQQTDQLKVDFVLPENEAQYLRKGSVVQVKSDQSESLQKATVIAIEPQVNQGTRNIKFRAQLAGSASMNPGAFVKVVVSAGKSKDALLLPTNCIIPESRNKKVAMIRNGKVVFEVVEIGFRGSSEVEITKGIQPGDTIAANGLLFLKPDAPVNIRSVLPTQKS